MVPQLSDTRRSQWYGAVSVSTPQKVQVFTLGVPAKGTPTARRRYRVKWRIDGRDRTRSLKTRVEADRFRRPHGWSAGRCRSMRSPLAMSNGYSLPSPPDATGSR